MKVIIMVSNIRSQTDINKIRETLSNEEGIIACYIKKDKGEVDVVYDDYFITKEEIEDTIEDMGYTIN